MTVHAPTKEGLRRLLDNWQFWVGIAYFGLVCVVIALWINFGRVATDQARTAEVVAARHADIVATAEAQYQTCVKSIPITKGVNGFVAGVQELGGALLVNSIQSHRATPPGSPLYQAQIANISRLRDALRKSQGIKQFNVASIARCLAVKQKEEAKS